MRTLLSLLILLVGHHLASAEAYVELPFEVYPGWNEQKVYSAKKVGVAQVTEFIPATALSPSESEGRLVLYQQGIWLDKDKKDITSLSAVGMFAVVRTLELSSECRIEFLKFDDLIKREIEHSHGTFYIQCASSIPVIGVLMTTRVKSSVVTFIRPIATNAAAADLKLDLKKGLFIFPGAQEKLRRDFSAAEAYMLSIGTE